MERIRKHMRVLSSLIPCNFSEMSVKDGYRVMKVPKGFYQPNRALNRKINDRKRLFARPKKTFISSVTLHFQPGAVLLSTGNKILSLLTLLAHLTGRGER